MVGFYSRSIQASNVVYDNASSGMDGTNLQDSTDELDLLRTYTSAGVLSAPSFTDNLDNTYTVGAVDAVLYDNANYTGKPRKYTIAQDSFEAVAGVPAVVYVDYNGGSPIYAITSNPTADINNSNQTDVYGILRNATIRKFPTHTDGFGMPAKLVNYNKFVNRTIYESGLDVSESGTRNVDVALGVVRFGATRIPLGVFDSTTDKLFLWYHSSGTWTEGSAITAYNNSQYDDGTDLQSLTSNRWTTNFVYRSTEDIDTVYLILGVGDHVSEALALAEEPLTIPNLPIVMQFGAILIGRIVVQQGVDAGTIQQVSPKIHFS